MYDKIHYNIKNKKKNKNKKLEFAVEKDRARGDPALALNGARVAISGAPKTTGHSCFGTLTTVFQNHPSSCYNLHRGQLWPILLQCCLPRFNIQFSVRTQGADLGVERVACLLSR